MAYTQKLEIVILASCTFDFKNVMAIHFVVYLSSTFLCAVVCKNVFSSKKELSTKLQKNNIYPPFESSSLRRLGRGIHMLRLGKRSMPMLQLGSYTYVLEDNVATNDSDNFISKEDYDNFTHYINMLHGPFSQARALYTLFRTNENSLISPPSNTVSPRNKVSLKETQFAHFNGNESDRVSPAGKMDMRRRLINTRSEKRPVRRQIPGKRHLKLIKLYKRIADDTLVKRPLPLLRLGKRPLPLLRLGKRPLPLLRLGKRPLPLLRLGKRPLPLLRLSKRPLPLLRLSKRPLPLLRLSKRPLPLLRLSKRPLPLLRLSKRPSIEGNVDRRPAKIHGSGEPPSNDHRMIKRPLPVLRLGKKSYNNNFADQIDVNYLKTSNETNNEENADDGQSHLFIYSNPPKEISF